MKKLIILASGGGTDAQSIIDYHAKLEKPSWEIAEIITNNPGAGVIARAEEAGIPHQVLPLKGVALDEALRKAFDAIEPDLVVLAGWLKMIGPKVLAKYGGQIINIHPGPLPATAGLYGLGVHKKVLELELKETAINVHFVDADYDTGQPIVTYPITVLTIASIMMDHEEAAKALQRYVLGYEHKLLPLIVDWLLSCSFMAVHTEGGVDIVINGKSVVKNSRLTEPLE